MKRKAGRQPKIHLIFSKSLQDTQIWDELPKICQSLSMTMSISEKIFPYTMIWMTENKLGELQTSLSALYLTTSTLGKLGNYRKYLKKVVKFFPQGKLIILIDSIRESIITKNENLVIPTIEAYEGFITSLTVEFLVNYTVLSSPSVCGEYISSLSEAIMKTQNRETASNHKRKFCKTTDKSTMAGFCNEHSRSFINQFMCMPSISEYKAIAIGKQYQSHKQLFTLYDKDDLEEDQKQQVLKDIKVQYGKLFGKQKALGKNVSNKVYQFYASLDPNQSFK
jgi:hypothetical protein